MNEEEIELMDIINVLWKRKWFIIIGTLSCMVIVGIISFLLKPVYEISALVQPGKFLVQDEQGRFEEVVIEKPQQVANRVNEKTYDHIIAKELKIKLDELPEIEAETIKDTSLIKIWTKNHDIERGIAILSKILQFIRKDIDEKIDAEIKSIEISISNLENSIKSKELLIKDKENEIKSKRFEIQSREIEKSKVNQEIFSTRNKVKISEERMKTLTEEMKEVKGRIDRLEEEQRKALKATNDVNAIGMLLYSNEIQNNLRYYNSLEERLSAEKVNFENLQYTIKAKEEDLKQLDTQISQINNLIDMLRNDIDKLRTEIENIKNQISLLKEKKRRIDYTTIIKSPTPSIHPVFPKKKLMVAVAGILSGMLFSFLAFFLEYIEKYRNNKLANE